jgi:hypothetical protein
VIDVMTRSKIHHLSEAGVPRSEIAVQCGVGLRSVERVLTELRGTSYSATARHLGAPATLLVRKRTIDIHVGDEKCEHRREDHTREVRRLPAHREDVLAALHGRRKLATFRRQCLLELGQPARQFLGQLVHRCPHGSWEKPCSDPYELLTHHSDGAMLDAFTRCVARSTFTVAAVRAALKEAA